MTQRYYELLRRKVLELNISHLKFFEISYQWRFDKVGDLSTDYCEFLQHAVVPMYAQAYLDYLFGFKDSYVQPDGQVRPHGEAHVST